MSDNRPTNDPASLAFLRGGLTRREVLRRAGIAGGTLAGAGLIAACGGGSASSGGGGGSSASGPVSISKTVAPNWTFSNWPLYIDIKNKTDHPSLDLFDKKYKTKTTYQEDIEDNDSFFGKVQAQLKANQDIGRDIVTLTDWMAAKWVALGYCEQLDLSLLPNVEANLVDALKGRSIDPQNNHLVPWQSGFTGLAYNPELTGFEVKNVEDLWHPNLKGKVTLLTEMRDTLGLTMLQLGIDPTKCTVDDAQKACDYLQTYVNNGQVRRFTGNDYASDLAKGNVYACMAWSGDIVQLQLDNPKLKFVFPEKGSMLWTDNMMIPKNASHPYNAHLWMNFYYQPEIAAMVEDYVNYVCPVNGAKDVLLKQDPAVAKNPLIFPTQDVLDNSFVFKALTPEDELQFNQAFQALQGS
jgi:spermidine/putrescine transport system substrate-binding protein